MWTKNRKRGIDTGRTAAGRPVRSIRKNNVLPGSGPTDLHFEKNDLVLSSWQDSSPQVSEPRRLSNWAPQATPSRLTSAARVALAPQSLTECQLGNSVTWQCHCVTPTDAGRQPSARWLAVPPGPLASHWHHGTGNLNGYMIAQVRAVRVTLRRGGPGGAVRW